MARQLAPENASYERDFYTWALRQAELVRAGRLAELDLDNVAEELESLGREQAHKLESAYRVLLLHLLKWMYQPGRRSRSWRGTIVRERTNAERILEDNPGLARQRPRRFATAYRGARKEAAAETGLSLAAFPETPPFTLAEASSEAFWPEAAVSADQTRRER